MNLIKITLLALTVCFIVTTACKKTKVQSATLELTYPDGTKESVQMSEGGKLLISYAGANHVLKASGINEHKLKFDIMSASFTADSAATEFTINKGKAQNPEVNIHNKISLGDDGNIQVNYTTAVMMQTGTQGPSSGCNGICCTKTCFTTYCCYDPHGCKDSKCDCAEPTNCPGTNPQPPAQAFFDLFDSGKDQMVFKR